LPAEPISLAEAAVEGAQSARVAVVEFTDYQCPICADFERQIKPVVRRGYIDTGQVLWAVRNFPLESKHPQAFKAATLAECARRQNHFQPIAAALFERQQSLGEALFLQLPHEFGLDQARLDECVAHDAQKRVRADLVLAQDLEISGTPTFLVGLIQPDHRVSVKAVVRGGFPLSSFRQALDDTLRPKWYLGWPAPTVGISLGVAIAATIIHISRRRRRGGASSEQRHQVGG